MEVLLSLLEGVGKVWALVLEVSQVPHGLHVLAETAHRHGGGAPLFDALVEQWAWLRPSEGSFQPFAQCPAL